MGSMGDFFRGKTPWQRRLSGELWHRKLRQQPTSRAPLVVFAIPLVSRRRSEDWEQVSRNLGGTLNSLRAQTSPDWCAYVCGQDRPDGVLFDERVKFVPYTGGDKFYDKGDKRLRLIETVLQDHAGRDGYYAQFDADDLLHPETVAHISADDNERGYLIESGYMADLTAKKVAPLCPQVSGRPVSDEAAMSEPRAFWQLCGSCVFARFDFRTQPAHWRRLLRRLKSHKRMSEVMAQHGVPLDPIPFPAGVYTLNHGENMSRRRKREAWRLGYLDLHALPTVEAEQVLSIFVADLQGP